MNARPYQKEILSAVDAGWNEFPRQLVVSPTGTGKTIVFSLMAKAAAQQNERTLVLVDQTELARQTVDKMERAAGLRCEVEQADQRASHDSPVVVSTVQSMSGRLDEWPADHFGLVIADEADKSITPTFQKSLRHFDGAARVCGFTATPNRSDQRSLGEYYMAIPFQAVLQDFIGSGKWAYDIAADGSRVQKNWLSPVSIKMLPINISMAGVKISEGDFDRNLLHDAIAPHLLEIAEAIKLHASFRKTLVFVPLIATSLKFVEICKGIGLHAEHIDGTSEDREEKLARFEAGEFDILVNSALLLRGVDIPAIDCVVMARPTKSVSLYQQAIGRGTRISPEKEDLLILDFLFDAQKKMVCRPANLIAPSQEEADAITSAMISESSSARPMVIGEQLTALDLMGMASLAQAQREKALRKKLEANKDRKAKTITAEEFAIRHNAVALATYEPVMPWEMQPVTERQAAALKRARVELETVTGKGHASQLLAVHFREMKIVAASPAQKSLMRRMGHPHPEIATADDARRFFSTLRQKKAA